MYIIRLPSCKQIGILAALLSHSWAQNNTFNLSIDACRIDFGVNEPVNATASRTIHWNALMMDPARNDWVLSLTFNDTRNETGTVYQWDSYLSTPDKNEAKACTFMFAGLNKTSSSTHRNGCDGIIEEACTSVLREISNFRGDCAWPAPLDAFTNRLREACGDKFFEPQFQTYLPIDFSNSTIHCSHSHVPGLAPQEGYRTVQAASLSISETNENNENNLSNYTWYDIYAKQTVPVVVAAEFFGGVGETQVICMRPSDITGGSRTPVQSGVARLRPPRKSLALFLMSAIMTPRWLI